MATKQPSPEVSWKLHSVSWLNVGYAPCSAYTVIYI